MCRSLFLKIHVVQFTFRTLALAFYAVLCVSVKQKDKKSYFFIKVLVRLQHIKPKLGIKKTTSHELSIVSAVEYVFLFFSVLVGFFAMVYCNGVSF